MLETVRKIVLGEEARYRKSRRGRTCLELAEKDDHDSFRIATFFEKQVARQRRSWYNSKKI